MLDLVENLFLLLGHQNLSVLVFKKQITDAIKLFKNHKEEKEEEKTALLLSTKNGKIAEMYEDLCDKTEMSLPNHLVSKHLRDEMKEEYELRVNQAR